MFPYILRNTWGFWHSPSQGGLESCRDVHRRCARGFWPWDGARGGQDLDQSSGLFRRLPVTFRYFSIVFSRASFRSVLPGVKMFVLYVLVIKKSKYCSIRTVFSVSRFLELGHFTFFNLRCFDVLRWHLDNCANCNFIEISVKLQDKISKLNVLPRHARKNRGTRGGGQ